MANKSALSADKGINKREGRTGRPKSSPLDRARNRALQAKRHLDLAESEFRVRLSDDLSDPERSAKVNAAAELRLKAAEVLNSARMQLSQASAEMKNNAPNALAHFESAKSAERSAWTAFRALPDLGFTQEEWDDPELRKRELGRPQLDVEIKFVRAKLAFDEAMKTLQTEEKRAGVKHVPLNALKDPVKTSRGQGLGRPKLDRLGILDLKLSDLEKKMEIIESELELKGNVVVQNRMGRKPEAPAAKLQRIKKEADEIRKLIEAEEAKLDRKGLLLRKLKKLRDERRRMTLEIKANPNNCEKAQERFDYLSERINERMAELAVLEDGLQPVQKALINMGNRNKPVLTKQPAMQSDFDLASIAVTPSTIVGLVQPEQPLTQPDKILSSEEVDRSTIGSADSSGMEQVSLYLRRAKAMAIVAGIDMEYAKNLEKICQAFDGKVPDSIARTLELDRQKERALVEDVELISQLN
jgi:hypothetical protein